MKLVLDFLNFLNGVLRMIFFFKDFFLESDIWLLIFCLLLNLIVREFDILLLLFEYLIIMDCCLYFLVGVISDNFLFILLVNEILVELVIVLFDE